MEKRYKKLEEYLNNASSLTIDEKIRKLRLKARLSQKELSEKLGVTQTTVSWWETGRHKISVSKLFKLSEFLNVPISYFQDEKIQRSNTPNSISKRIRQLRLNLGISARKLAAAIDADPTLVSCWERDLCDPSVKNILLLSEYFNVTTDYLIKGKL